MFKKSFSKKNNKHGFRAQAIAEFAIALPILLVVLVGIFEVGRMVFIYAAVTNASRNAVRYASAVGWEDTGSYHKYLYCDGIKDTAVRSAFLVRLTRSNVTVSYDGGPGTGSGSKGSCTVSGGEAAVSVSSGDRVEVVVTATYKPMVKLIPFPTRTITATSYRTILGIVDLAYP